MRVLHIMASQAQGGAETYSTDVILSLHKSGIDQCVVMAKNAPRFRELERAGIRMAPKVLASPFRFIQKIRLRRLVAREKPTLVHCWMRRAASLLPSSWGNVSHANPKTIGWFGGYYDPAKFKSCANFVGVTRDIVAHMIKNGVPKERTHYISTFPDVPACPPIDRSTVSTPRESKVLLALSRFHPKKGLDILLQSLALLPDCILWLAGEGPLRRALENEAEVLGVLDRVRFLGWRTDRAALLRAADICVLPSRYEPFGTVILEAWAAGTPLIAAASAGPSAYIEDGNTGLLTPIDDVAALSAAIKRVLADSDLRRKLVTQGYAAYVKDFTREAVTTQWLKFYKSLEA